MPRDRLASLAMYHDPPPVAAATRAMWAYLRDRLRETGLPDMPDVLNEEVAHDAAWLDPRLLLAQSCGYPYAKSLRGRVKLVATPVYDHPGCDGVLNGSVLIVRDGDEARTLADLRGRRAAINDPASNSGANLLRHAVAPHAIDGRFFGDVIETGSHLASLAAIAGGNADVAAIDCVTFGNLAHFADPRLAGIRILGETAKTPGLPLITLADASDGEIAALRGALADFAADPAMAEAREALGLRGFEIVPDDAYDRVLEIEQEAIALGYPDLRYARSTAKSGSFP